ncbi:MAG: flagellar basal body-associated FliL family protein [Hyphomicrobiales bacterium]|nr:flagellar basal body-associated FliL family protein [Hyphomicrobiales bacterium]
MSDEPEATEAESDDESQDQLAEVEAAEAAPKKRGPGPLKLVAVIVPLLLALGGGGYVAVDMFGLFAPGGGAGDGQKAPLVYYDLPEMVVNLSSAEQRAQYLKLKVSLEAEDKKVIEALQPALPRVLDMFQLYLRELRSTDLDGSAGIFRLKEELLRRVNIEIYPNKVTRVLFKEIIVQ